jgi:hypothetical protein
MQRALVSVDDLTQTMQRIYLVAVVARREMRNRCVTPRLDVLAALSEIEDEANDALVRVEKGEAA